MSKPVTLINPVKEHEPFRSPTPTSKLLVTSRYLSLLFGGVFAGFLVTVLVLELTLRDYDRFVYTQVRQVMLVRLDTFAGATLGPTLLATAIVLGFGARTRGRSFWLTLSAFLLLVSVVVVTVAFNMPINADQVDWNVQAPPADWATVRDHWQLAHGVRTGAALLAFVLLCAAALRRSPAATKLTDPGRR